MTSSYLGQVGFACSYTPLALIDAAGFIPRRIFPLTSAPDQAGALLHDGLCPHVKRILDRAISDDFGDLLGETAISSSLSAKNPLTGIVLVNCCDAMRRLADALHKVRPDIRLTLMDLPMMCDDRSVTYLGSELAKLQETLASWANQPVPLDAILESQRKYDRLGRLLSDLHQMGARSDNGATRMQRVINQCVSQPVDRSITQVTHLLEESWPPADPTRPPVFLFGNVLPDPQAFDLFSECGIQVVDNDLCTSQRQFRVMDYQTEDTDTFLSALARTLLERTPCARTIPVSGGYADHILERATECGARAVIAHVMKFCDPYLDRLIAVRQKLREADLPLLVLEGDCTLRSLGQHRTRIEAFAEMLGE